MKILYVKMHDHEPEHVIILESSNFEFASNCMLEEEKVAGKPEFLWLKPQSLTRFCYTSEKGLKMCIEIWIIAILYREILTSFS